MSVIGFEPMLMRRERGSVEANSMMDSSANPEQFSEVVYLPEMDQDSRRLISEITRVLKEWSAPKPEPITHEPADTSSIRLDVNTLQNDLKWHRTIGWAIALAYASIFGIVLNWLVNDKLPEKLNSAKSELNVNIDNQKNELLRASTSQFSTISQQLAVMGATIELLKPEIQKRLGQALQDRATGNGAQLRLNLQTADELAKQALASSVKTDPRQVGQAGASFIGVASSAKDETDKQLAWQAVSSIVNYRSFLFAEAARYSRFLSFPPCFATSSTQHGTIGPLADGRFVPFNISSGAKISQCVADLDETKEAVDVVFEDCLIKYSGGPLNIKNTTFKNCIFLFSVTQPPSARGKELSQTLMAANLTDVHFP